ncbi:ABC transporter ATP-binding protein [Nodosilinea sp. LEGE 07298]|uniref:ABC transporter ATP-binding protein n=1 Tax=Nodosilinea sp. LEGE 07298 TaxID=2777970 RepID=UPI001881C66C|nr:ABC transporter ATP-binding protein [Nodosilinea sp. LEGE 07298]
MLNYFHKFLYVFSGHHRQLFLLVGIFLLTSILEAFGIGLIGPFLSLAGDPQAVVQDSSAFAWAYQVLGLNSLGSLVVWFGIFIIVIFLIKGTVYFLSKRYSYKVLFDQRAAVQKRLFNTYLLAPYDFHISRNTADYINKITNETQRFGFMVSLPMVEFVSHFIVVLTLLVLMARTNTLLLLVSLASLLPAFFVFSFLLKRLKEWGRLSTLAREETIKAVNHGLGGIKETRVFGCEEYFRKGLEEHVHQEARVEILFQSAQFVPRTMIETLLVIAIVGFVCVSQLLLGQDFQSAISSMGVFAVASLRLIPAASNLADCVGKLKNSSHTLDIMYLDLKEIDNNEFSKQDVRRLPGSSTHDSKVVTALKYFEKLTITDISYQYPGASKPSLTGISMEVKKGESIGLIGQSGAGKTTLVDVILSLLMPQSGDIAVDGQSVYENISSWRNLVGYIPQSIFLTDETIEKNIAFGIPKAEIDQSRLWYAIKTAQLEELVQDLPNGIDTAVGERGIRLSGGQRQRIGIARALYHQREILVLDEATSALDNETEQLISNSIRALAGSKTLIIIAHRLSTIEHCDRIYVLDKGTIARSGTYADVVLAPQA